MEGHWKFLGVGGLKRQNFRNKVLSLTEISWGMGGGTKNLLQGGSVYMLWNYTFKISWEIIVSNQSMSPWQTNKKENE